MQSPTVPGVCGSNGSGTQAQHRQKYRFLFLGLFLVLLSPVIFGQVSADDLTEAEMLSKTYKDEQVVCRSSYHYFTFDKGKNSLQDKVVVVQQDAEMEFLSLRKYASVTYSEFYNKFIELKTFKKALKWGNKFVTSKRSGIDRAVTDENIFFDDSRVQYFPVRFSDSRNNNDLPGE